MTRFMQAVQSFGRQDEGQDLLEYALLVALIALVAVGAVTAAGVQVNNIFTRVADGEADTRKSAHESSVSPQS